MLKPNLQLAPHELAPRRRADVDGEPFIFCALWQVRGRDFIGQVVGQSHAQMILYALADEPERGNFVSAPVWVSKNSDRPATPTFEPRTCFAPEDARRIVELTADSGWGRLYFLDEDLNLAQGEAVRWRLFLACSGWGEWSAAPGFYENSARFRWNEDAVRARQKALLPPLELLALVHADLLDEQSDAALARQFAPLRGKIERHQLCCPVARGSYGQWKQILEWYLQSHFPVKAKEKARIKIDIHSPSQDSVDKWLVGGRFSCFAPNAAQFCDWTRQYFAPQRDEDYLKRCSAAAHWANRSVRIGVAAARPTQHERLEALLKLRDWLRDKASPAEIERLLRDE